MVRPAILTVTFSSRYKRWVDGSDGAHHVLEAAQVPALPLLGLHFAKPQFLLLSYYPVGGIEAQNNAGWGGGSVWSPCLILGFPKLGPSFLSELKLDLFEALWFPFLLHT